MRGLFNTGLTFLTIGRCGHTVQLPAILSETTKHPVEMTLSRVQPSRHLFTIFALLLLALLVLAVLQYKWIGQVSAAERQRMQESIRKAAMDIVGDFGWTIGVAAAASSCDFRPCLIVGPNGPSEGKPANES